MLRIAIVVAMFVHAVIHAAIWATPARSAASAPFDAAHSWLIGTQPSIAMALGLIAAALWAISGAGLVIQAEWWRSLAVLSSAVSLTVIALFFNAWFLAAAAVDVGVIVFLTWIGWPGKELIGA